MMTHHTLLSWYRQNVDFTRSLGLGFVRILVLHLITVCWQKYRQWCSIWSKLFWLTVPSVDVAVILTTFSYSTVATPANKDVTSEATDSLTASKTEPTRGARPTRAAADPHTYVYDTRYVCVYAQKAQVDHVRLESRTLTRTRIRMPPDPHTYVYPVNLVNQHHANSDDQVPRPEIIHLLTDVVDELATTLWGVPTPIPATSHAALSHYDVATPCHDHTSKPELYKHYRHECLCDSGSCGTSPVLAGEDLLSSWAPEDESRRQPLSKHISWP